MKKLVSSIIFMLLLTISYGQTEWFYRNVINQELTLKSDISIFKNISPIVITNEGFNDKYVALIGKDSVNLVPAIGEYFRLPGIHYRKNPIKSYVLTNSPNKDSIYIVLSFCFDKLYSVSLYATGNYYVSNMRRDFARQFDWKNVHYSTTDSNDSIVHYGNRIVTYGTKVSEIRQGGRNKKFIYTYEENLIKGKCGLTIMDKEIQDRIPSWCGNSRDNNTWEKLELFLKKKP